MKRYLPAMHSEANDPMCEDDSESSTDVIRLVLIVGMGTTVAVIGVLLNSMLLLSFSRIRFRNSNMLYFFLLAVFDIFVELCFMLIFPSALIWEYFRVEMLYTAWHHYIRYISTCGQVLIAASTLLIVSASFERYICSLNSSTGINPKKRFVVVICVMLSAIVMKVSYLP
uniref:G_PROTEIN_RECEP_F1_2 domain-containing protein n=1 Tax=Angiostrongylus cantonensis TaxID=6313 RepID=A0A0K0DPP6_ANGCA